MHKKSKIFGWTSLVAIVIAIAVTMLVASCGRVNIFSAIKLAYIDRNVGVELYDDDNVNITVGRWRVVSIGGHGDNDNLRHFVRHYLQANGIFSSDSTVYIESSEWDDFYINVTYKSKVRDLNSLESVISYLYSGEEISFKNHEGEIWVLPPKGLPPEI